MEVIVNLNSQRFTLNGVSYYKNFMPHVSGNKIRIVNAYDSKFVLMPFRHYGEISVNGGTFDNVQDLQFALLPVLFIRSTLGDGNSTENGIVQLSPIETLTGPNRIKIPVSPDIPIWMIGGVSYSKDTETIIPIEDATEGKYRIDIIVANTANDFELIQGQENDDFAVPPTVPYNVVEIAQVAVYGENIGTTIPTSGFIKMSSKQFRTIALNSPTATQLFISNDWTTYRLVEGDDNAASVVSGFNSITIPASVYDGCDIFIINDTEEVVTLKHNDGGVLVPFFFNEAADFLLAPNKLKHLKYRSDINKVIPVFSVEGEDGAEAFTDLSDTPNTYEDNAKKVPYVKEDETGIDFSSVLYIDEANKRIGINTETPDQPLTILRADGNPLLRVVPATGTDGTKIIGYRGSSPYGPGTLEIGSNGLIFTTNGGSFRAGSFQNGFSHSAGQVIIAKDGGNPRLTFRDNPSDFYLNMNSAGDLSFNNDTEDVVVFNNSGAVILNKYGVGTFVGTAVKMLAVTSNGHIIEEDMPTPGVAQTLKITIPAEDLRGCGTTPFTLKQAVGAAKIINPISVTGFYDFSGSANTFPDDLVIRVGNMESFVIDKAILNGSADDYFIAYPAGKPVSGAANSDMVLTGSNSSGGLGATSTLTLFITYTIDDFN